MSINSRIWLTALQKPVKMSEKKDWDDLDIIARWLIATRAEAVPPRDDFDSSHRWGARAS